jgi:hypothetical protein
MTPDTGRRWLISWHRDDVRGAIEGGSSVMTPALGRHLRDVAPGDRVAFWVSGPRDSAGVWALGTVSSEVYESAHRRSYAVDGSPVIGRPTVDVTIDAQFRDRWIPRGVLRADDRFRDFALFQPGQARGTNPRPLTEEQWQAILEHQPP